MPSVVLGKENCGTLTLTESCPGNAAREANVIPHQSMFDRPEAIKVPSLLLGFFTFCVDTKYAWLPSKEIGCSVNITLSFPMGWCGNNRPDPTGNHHPTSTTRKADTHCTPTNGNSARAQGSTIRLMWNWNGWLK